MARNTIETVMGAVVLLVAAGFVWLGLSVAGIQSAGGNRIHAEFGGIAGLGVGDEVRISGIAVGKVVATDLDTEKFNARVTLSVDERIRLPSDSSARIVASSLLGGNHVEIIPGFEEEMLANGDTIFDTRDPVNLADLLGKAVFSGGAGGND